MDALTRFPSKLTSCVYPQLGRQPIAAYSALLKTSLHALASVHDAAQHWALAAVVEHWPPVQALQQPAPALLGTPHT